MLLLENSKLAWLLLQQDKKGYQQESFMKNEKGYEAIVKEAEKLAGPLSTRPIYIVQIARSFWKRWINMVFHLVKTIAYRSGGC